MGRPEVRERVLPDSARHLSRRSRSRPAIDQVALDRWKELGADGVVVGSVRKGADRRDGAGPADQRGGRRVGDGQGVQRQRAQHSVNEAAGSTRTPSPTRCTRSSAALSGVARTQARLHVRSRRRADPRAGGRPRHLEHLHRRLRRRAASSASPISQGARHHAGVGARRHARSPSHPGAAAIRTSIVLFPYGDRRCRIRPRARRTTRTTCRPGRRTAPRSRSRRAATATRRST